ncbi:MAG TPA: NHL repeat-containing protein [Terriglobia bacterium]|nr:NHL repeat-containing protein [Terriglobia bacterium]
MTTYAGHVFPLSGVPAEEAWIGTPGDIAVDPRGGFFFTTSGQTPGIYHVSQAGILTHVAGPTTGDSYSGQFRPRTLAAGRDGSLIFSEDFRIRRRAPDGAISDIAGTGKAGYSRDGGPAISAMIGEVGALIIEPDGSVLFADIGDGEVTRIRRIGVDGRISTILGPTYTAVVEPGRPARETPLSRVHCLTMDHEHNLYIADSRVNRILKAHGNEVQVIAGGGTVAPGDGKLATSVSLSPLSLAVDSKGNVFVNDSNRIRRIRRDGVLETAAGNGTFSTAIDSGRATLVSVLPGSIAVTSDGAILISEPYRARIRKVTPNGMIRTVAGADPLGDKAPATHARLEPGAVAGDRKGNVFVTDRRNNRIRKVDARGIITTYAGNGKPASSGAGGSATSAGMAPRSIAVDKAGNLYFVDGDRIREVTTKGDVRTVAGNGTSGFAGEAGPAINAQLYLPAGLAVDEDGNLFLSTAHYIRKVSTKGIITTIAGTFQGFNGDGGPARRASLSQPQGLALDDDGNLFIADYGAYRVRKISPNGVISTIAGNGNWGVTIPLGDGGPATFASVRPMGIAVDRAGNVFITEPDTNRIRRIAVDGTITTVAGDGTRFWEDRSSSPLAPLPGPSALTIDAAGNLFVTTVSGLVRKMKLN